MTFEVKQLPKLEFYETFCKWLDVHKFPRINQAVLPENVFICYTEGIPIYCFWFYRTDSKLAWLAFPASAKNVNFKKKQGGMEFLLEHITNYCKKKKILTLITTSNTQSVIDPLLSNGFEVGDSGVSHLIKKI